MYEKQSPDIIISIIGFPGSGKTTFSDILLKKLYENKVSVFRYKVSDWKRKFLERLDMKVNHDEIVCVDEYMRLTCGEDYWIDLMYKDILSSIYNVVIVETAHSFRDIIKMKEISRIPFIIVLLHNNQEILIKRIMKKDTDIADKLQKVDFINKYGESLSNILNNTESIDIKFINYNGIENLYNLCNTLIVEYIDPNISK